MDRKRRIPPKYKKLTELEWEELQIRWEAGESAAALAREFGCSDSTIQKRRRVHGWERVVAPPPRMGQPIEGESVNLKYPNNETVAEGGSELLRPDTVAGAPRLPDRAREATSAHLRAAKNLRHRLDQLLAEPQRHTPENSRLSRTLLEASQTLEKIQRVERVALEMDGLRKPGPAVVILIPDKKPLEEWQAHALVIQDAEVVEDEAE